MRGRILAAVAVAVFLVAVAAVAATRRTSRDQQVRTVEPPADSSFNKRHPPDVTPRR
jgi:hypothetical protein